MSSEVLKYAKVIPLIPSRRNILIVVFLSWIMDDVPLYMQMCYNPRINQVSTSTYLWGMWNVIWSMSQEWEKFLAPCSETKPSFSITFFPLVLFNGTKNNKAHRTISKIGTIQTFGYLPSFSFSGFWQKIDCIHSLSALKVVGLGSCWPSFANKYGHRWTAVGKRIRPRESHTEIWHFREDFFLLKRTRPTKIQYFPDIWQILFQFTGSSS